ncbi:ATP-dependent DNA helicase Q4-like [Liolophura sinensis]|uniref:ATP-dependent DNA helicase Q4-like n=1 Tax=Liolophura sinensis TaxID=3198878 RepID=UPI0031582C34
MDEAYELKKELKKWEAQFVQEQNRKPKKSDINAAPDHIQAAYEQYNELKRKIRNGENNVSDSFEAWSESLNKSHSKVTPSRKEEKKPSSAKYLEKLGAKLFQNAKSIPPKQVQLSKKTCMTAGGKNLLHTKWENSCENAVHSEGLPATSTQAGVFGKALMLSHRIIDKHSVNIPEGPLIPEPFRKRERSSVLGKKFLQVKSGDTSGDDFMELSDSSLTSEIKESTSLQKTNSGKICTDNSMILEKSTVEIKSRQSLLHTKSTHTVAKSVPFALTESGQIPELSLNPDPFHYNDDLEAERELSGSRTGSGEKEKDALAVRKKAPAVKRPIIEDDSDEESQPCKKSKASDQRSPKDTKPEAREERVESESVSVTSAPARKVSSRPMKTDNFVRLNMRTKGYRRKGKGMTGPQHKRMLWKNKMAARASSRGDTCYKCGETGHWANKCPQKGGSKRQPHKFNFGDNPKKKTKPVDDLEVEEASFDFDMDIDLEEGVIPTAYEAPVAPPAHDPLVLPNNDGTLPDMEDLVQKGLQKFGFDSFRDGQEKAVKRILCGLSTLVVLSTGAGKSLCYQLPAYLYAQRSKCITLVISPLVSLMEDQIAGLPKGVKGACFHSNMTKVQRDKVMSALSDGVLHFLLVSPETIAGGGGGFSHGNHINPGKLPPVAFVCIDEAHCLSEWSHHFRPSYLRLCKVLREKFGVQCFLGLTATATLSTAADVSRHLNIKDFEEATIRGQPVPDNLRLSVSRDEDRDEALIQLLQGERMLKCASIIIYCTRRDETERLATLIRTCLKDSALSRETVEAFAEQQKNKNIKKSKSKSKADNTTWDAESYHAGMSAAQRKRVQNAFMSGRLRIVVATVAFGMGLDKSDVRAVIHYNMPKSFESYVQEIGRAGRDRKVAHCHVFLDQEGADLCELRRHTFGNTIDRFTIKKLLERVFHKCRCKEIQERANQFAEACEFPDDDIDYSRVSEELTPSTTAGNAALDNNVKNPEKCYPSDNDGRVQDKAPSVRACPGHERAIPIEPTVMALDVKEEGLATLLCYLELRADRIIQNMPPVYATCKLQCYGGPLQLEAVAKKCPPVAVTIARLKKDGNFDKKRKDLDFNVTEVADSMGWDSGPVKRELKLLQWDFSSTGAPVKSGVMVEFSDLAFHLRSPGDLSDDERDRILDELNERVKRQERTELRQLKQLHTALTSVSHKAYWMCADEVDLKRDQKLKSIIDQYFENQSKPDEENLQEEQQEELAQVDSTTLNQLQADIRSFIHTYSVDHSLNGRVIARIFHGIPSPCFPAPVWGRVRRYWRTYMHLDFNLVMKMAAETMVKMRM